jgi:TetR/AcrR family transcriptional regulator
MAELFADIVHSAAWSGMFRTEDTDKTDQRLSMIFEMFTTGIQNTVQPNKENL